ncbi:type II toxin-antitoxin system VapC family toxin [Yersinia kristensenii]|nr:type II toxin-antitoxin system VapC family toxin [Yersinia kristensenii]NIL07956.1 type II toxin-antitoxin system VapC family toxin [Yersinia kristensenii]
MGKTGQFACLKTRILKGSSIGGNDAAIAGHAISAGAILMTNNIREFERVKQ